MMYQEKMVVALKSSGKVLREFKDNVYLPFGSEYSVFIKNMNTRRAIIHIEIDGTKVSEGGFIVDGNSSIDIERFVKDLNVGNKFKFIERTSSIEKHRGVGAEDGLIRIEFEYEQDRKEFFETFNWNNITISGSAYPPQYVDAIANTWLSGTNNTGDVTLKSSTLSSPTIVAQARSFNEVGITVPGSISEQKFSTVSAFPTDGKKHVIIIKILGQTSTTEVVEPITVKSKPECKYCGKLNKHDAKFCGECGAGLQIV